MYYHNPPRRGPDVRRVRGRATRSRLLSAATREFGLRGYDATSTRTIASVARANQASIRYHFGGKDELYLAVANSVAEKHGNVLLPMIMRSRRAFPNRATARNDLAEIMAAFTRQLLDVSDAGAGGMFVARELMTPGVGFPILYHGYIRELHEHVTTLLARATARLPRAFDAIIDAHSLIGAALGFASMRRVLRQRSYRPTFTKERVELVAGRIAALTGYMSEQRAMSPTAIAPPRVGTAYTPA